MSTQVQTLLEAALELSEIEREELAERIYDSLGDPETEVDDDAWSDELKRRVDNAKSGKTVWAVHPTSAYSALWIA